MGLGSSFKSFGSRQFACCHNSLASFQLFKYLHLEYTVSIPFSHIFTAMVKSKG